MADFAAGGCLGCVEGSVAELHEVFQVEGGALDGGDSDAGADAELSGFGGDAEVCEVIVEAVGGECSHFCVGAGHDDEELVAAEAGDEVSGPHGGAEAVGDGLKGEVSGVMAVFVVDLLEVVDVEHEG